MIRPSPELAAIARRFVEAERAAAGETLEGLLLDSDHLRYIGTAPGEIWGGRSFRDGIARHAAEVPPYEIREDTVEAFEHGQTGWANWLGAVLFPGFERRELRYTFVFVLAAGHWRIANSHFSYPVPNQDVAGFDHSAIDDLLEALRQGGVAIGAEGLATIMFTDIAQSTTLAAALGDRQWSQIIARHLNTLREIAEAHGGHVVKTLGDGAMIRFAATGPALAAAIDLQRAVDAEMAEPRLAIRVGLHAGEVIETAGDFFGTVVNKAARIADAAAPGQILVSDAARAMIGAASDLMFDAPVRVAIRGLDGAVEVSALNWRA